VILNQLLSYCTNGAQEDLDKMRMLTALLCHKDVLIKNKLQFLHFTISAIILNRKRDHILMIYDKLKKIWTWFEVHINNDSEIIQSLIKEIKNKTGLRKVTLLCNQILSIQIVSEDNYLQIHPPSDLQVIPHFHYTLTFAFMANMNHLTPGKSSQIYTKWISLERIEQYVQSDSLLCAIKKVTERCRLLFSPHK
jgi:hypothetical protein